MPVTSDPTGDLIQTPVEESATYFRKLSVNLSSDVTSEVRRAP
jgi:hypothetical protein